ncbi:MAG: DNA polymerase III subunit delta [Chitinophagaceae bacterium]|nr:MAG: DNA polymerase III subunit delta [Chitinophagaceae bacterium]
MTFEALEKELKSEKIRPVYLLEGEEDFFIDRISNFLENDLLTETEKEFNLTIFYGRDADWANVLNACRRYPVFAERQVVMIKEAQHMKSLEKLESYLENPLVSTALVLVYRQGKLDGRTAFKKLIDKKGVSLTTKKLYDDKIPGWIKAYAEASGHDISPKAAILLADHIGNDLARISNEIDKLLLNIHSGKKIDEDDIEKYVGISKEYNVFEFQKAVGNRDFSKAVRILNYFSANPKAAPSPVVFTVLYAFFSKVHAITCSLSSSDKDMATKLGINPYFFSDYMRAAKAYQRIGAERALLLLYEYNLRSIGINDAGTPGSELLKEMTMKIMS